MSHSVTITRTTTTTSTSAIIVNTGYLKTLPGLLKLAELIICTVCVGLLGYYFSHYNNYSTRTPELFFLLMSVSFLIGTFCLLTSCLISLATSSLIAKTIYEVIYHCIACILIFSSALTLLVEVNNKRFPQYYYEPYLAASILGLINAALYLISTILATKQYRGI